jgi:DNA-binding transcriptional LysR family regulator
MQIDLLDTFLDLLETRSFHRTAERLGVSQSTVSGRVRALEAALGARIFDRSRAGVQLTTEGLRFEPHARALRLGWSEALRGTRGAGARALTLRIGIQHDLAGSRLGDWLAAFRRALPDCGFYIELDYSNQMCADLATGALDFAVMFSPRPHPDLHFVTLGEVRYRMASTDAECLSDVRTERYILGNFAPAIAAAHRAALPHLHDAPVASGQNAAVAGLLATIGGAAYLAEETAAAMVAAGTARMVADAPVLTQPVHAGMLLRHRTGRMHAQLLSIVRHQFGARRGGAGG